MTSGVFTRGVTVDDVGVRAFTVPTDAPEADGTLSWGGTTIVVVQVAAGGEVGMGYTYTSRAAVTLIEDVLMHVIDGCDALSPPRSWQRMRRALRNAGYPGVGACALSAVDVALWDLKAKLLGLSLATLLGRVRDRVPAYGSGGFTSYGERHLERQLADWLAAGFSKVKIKVGSEPEADPDRVRDARSVLGEEVELFVDANGAYERKQALQLAETFAADAGVSWFEEPVSSEDLDGLRLLRDRAPAGMVIAAGEYGYQVSYFRQMLCAGAVDVLQADVTRCGGITGFIRVASLCAAFEVPLSAHGAPSLAAHAGAIVEPLIHLEYFHDHVLVERGLFDGVLDPVDGALEPDPERAGLGLELREQDAKKWAV